MENQYVTNGGRVVLALIVGALLGAAWFALDYGYAVFQQQGLESFVEYGIRNTLLALTYGAIVWFLCLAIFGGPVWIFLHFSGFRQWWIGVLAGYLVPFLVMIIMLTGFFTGYSS
ncbi:MAG: hypothetical protein AAFY48_13700 [Bacteroidota bacterium]